MPVVTVGFFNAHERQVDRRSCEVPDLCRPTIEAVVDHFDAQIGTVFDVYHDDRCLHRSAARLSDLT